MIMSIDIKELIIKEAKDKCHSLLKDKELNAIYDLSKEYSEYEGDFAECGVYSGGSAHIIASNKSQFTKLHLFDTFEGLPYEDPLFLDNKKGDLKGNIDEVKSDMNNFYNVIFHKGLFTDTLADVYHNMFSFVHIDADQYISCLEAISFFFKRLSRNGIILLHDRNSESVRKAIIMYFTQVEVSYLIKQIEDTEYVIIKRRNMRE
jgi:O-methyltransferase